MVGFIREPSKQEEESGANQQKHKVSNGPESFRFDFEGYSSEFGGFSLASVEPFLDFDSIKDWIEEMQAPDNAESDKADIGSELCVESRSEDQIGSTLVDLVQGMNGSEKPVSVKAECSGSDEHMDGKDGIGGDNGLVKSDVAKDCSMDVSMKNAELGSSELAEINSDCYCGDTKTSHGDEDESGIGVLGDINRHKIETLDCSIEEGLEKVTLVGDDGGLVVTDSGMKKMDTPVVNEESHSESVSDSECETSSSSSSASSSSSDSDDDDDEEEVKEKLFEIKKENTKQAVDLEEGQIMDSDAEHMVSWSENNEKEEDDDENSDDNSEELLFGDDSLADEDGDIVKEPVKSKNELKVLPPVPPVDVTLQPCHQISPVGVVLSVLGAQVIVEGSEKHNPLSEGSILWIAETRLPLGIVDEIFGPVKTPYYIVRYNSETEVPSGIQSGTLVGFVLDFVGHVLNDKNLYQKGYDASGENDEEVLDAFDFSDDEKEAEFKKMLKMSKRGNNNNQGQGPGNKKKNNRNREKTWTKDQSSMSQSSTVQSSQPTQMQQHMGPPVSSSREGNQVGPSSTGPVFSGRPAVPPSSQGQQFEPSPMGQFFPRGPNLFPQQFQQAAQQVQQAGLLLNTLFPNGMPFQQQNMAFAGGFQMNGMPWMQQNPPQNLQVASGSPVPWQQQQHVSQMPFGNQQPFDLSQLVRPMNFAAGPTNAPWVGMLGQNFSNQAPLGLQGPSSQFPTVQGQSCNSQPPTSFSANEQTSTHFSRGFSSGRGGRGRGRKPFHRRGGQFGGGRGRQQPN